MDFATLIIFDGNDEEEGKDRNNEEEGKEGRRSIAVAPPHKEEHGLPHALADDG